jgi:predicted Zn-dependent protease
MVSPMEGEVLEVNTEVLKDPSFAFDPVRKQCHATSLLRHLSSVSGDGPRLLGVTAVDLYAHLHLCLRR